MLQMSAKAVKSFWICICIIWITTVKRNILPDRAFWSFDVGLTINGINASENEGRLHAVDIIIIIKCKLHKLSDIFVDIIKLFDRFENVFVQ